jgi:hypothetical protein
MLERQSERKGSGRLAGERRSEEPGTAHIDMMITALSIAHEPMLIDRQGLHTPEILYDPDSTTEIAGPTPLQDTWKC